MTINHRMWTWTGKKRRHCVSFTHHTISGGQLLIVDGDEYYRVSSKYRLTGCLFWTLDGEGGMCELFISAPDLSTLTYTLTLDGKEIPAVEDRVATTWIVPLEPGAEPAFPAGESFPTFSAAGGPKSPGSSGGSPVSPGPVSAVVEFDHRSMDVFVNGLRIEAEGDFLDEGEGSQYRFNLPPPPISVAAFCAAPAAGAGVAGSAPSAGGAGSIGARAAGRECRLIVQPLGDKSAQAKAGMLKTTLLVDEVAVQPASGAFGGAADVVAASNVMSAAAAAELAARLSGGSGGGKDSTASGSAGTVTPAEKGGVLRFQVGKGFTA